MHGRSSGTQTEMKEEKSTKPGVEMRKNEGVGSMDDDELNVETIPRYYIEPRGSPNFILLVKLQKLPQPFPIRQNRGKKHNKLHPNRET
jgi:hypothetical protein